MFHVLQVSTGYSDGSVEREHIEAAGGKLTLINSADEKDIIEAGKDADGLLVTLTEVSATLMEALPKLKIVVRAGIGVDNIDLNYAKKNNIMVCNLPTYCQDEVADHTVSMLLCLERKLYPQICDIKKGKWEKASAYAPVLGLKDAIVGFIGYGGIAQKVFVRLKAFGLKGIAYDPYVNPMLFQDSEITLVSLEEILTTSDFISLHVPLTEQTRHIINRDTLAMMKKSAYLINTSRGSLVDNTALLESLKYEELAGAALDVIADDLAGSDLFKDLDNVIITPHTAYYSDLSSYKIRSQAGDIFASFIRGQVIHSVI